MNARCEFATDFGRSQCEKEATVALTEDGKLKTPKDLGIVSFDGAPLGVELYCYEHGKANQEFYFK